LKTHTSVQNRPIPQIRAADRPKVAYDYRNQKNQENVAKSKRSMRHHYDALCMFHIQELSTHSTHFTLLMSSPDRIKSYSDITHSMTEMHLSG